MYHFLKIRSQKSLDFFKHHDLVSIDEVNPAIQVFLGILLIFASAQITIPIKPVPITLHTVAVSLIALTYSPKLAFTTILSFLALGIGGLPVFSHFNSGLTHFLSASCGYHLGMLIAAPIMSFLYSLYFKNSIYQYSRSRVNNQYYRHDRTDFSKIVTILLIGHVIIYICGIFWLIPLIGFWSAIYGGFMVYIPTGVAKLMIFAKLFVWITKE